MKIVIVGTGYVGLVTGACLAEVGLDVTCVDIDKAKIEGLKNGIIPIFEPGLEEIVKRNFRKNRLRFSTNLSESIIDAKVVFSAVGTPPDEDGSADLKYVIDVAKEVGENMQDYLVLVTKSTVPVGTAKKVKKAVQDELDKRNVKIDFDVASNPEFLKEGAAISDFLKPDRIIVGVETDKAKNLMKKLYKPFLLNRHPLIFMDIPSAEMTKYASNAMLATKISFINDIANLCELLGADVQKVREGMGSDSRIGYHFIYPGIGYGGSCFPKDVKALIKTADDNNYDLRVLKAVEKVNKSQKSLLYRKINKYFNGKLSGLKIALWGLSFKPNTDDMREAPSLVLIEKLTNAGAEITAYDPVAINETKRRIGNKINYAKGSYKALKNADFLIIATEWPEFRMPKFDVIKKELKKPLIFDGRNIYNKDEMKKLGFEYFGIGF